MKQANPLPHWPRAGVAIRVPPRRIAGSSPSCDVIEFTGAIAEPLRTVAWDAIATALPRAARVVLLVAAEDVSFVVADVPALSGPRLREALPNLVEDRTVGDVATLHVALGQPVDESGASPHARVLAVVDRTWLAAMQVHVVRAGLRVAAIVPDALTVPKSADAWSIAVTAMDESTPAVSLRRAAQQALSLGADETSAAAIAATVVRTTVELARPKRFDLYASSSTKARAKAIGEAVARATNIPLHDAGGDPFVAWLEGGGATGTFGPPLSLFASDHATGALGRSWHRWRIAAVLAIALVAVQIAGMQWQWAGLRAEASDLRRQQAALLTAAFPDTRVILDAPLQMERGLATMRASAGRNDPGDFSAMVAASARIFASLPSNTLRSVDYETRALRLRFATGSVTASDVQQRLVAQAATEGYVLRFEPGSGANAEPTASLRPSGASR